MQQTIGRYLAGAVTAVTSVTLCAALLVLLPSTAAAASTEPDIPAGDLCGHVHSRDVYALIASPGDGTFSVDSTQQEAGKLTCVWSAQQTGAADGAASGATLTLDLYHFADAARARTQLRGFGVTPHAPQTHTDNADDEVILLSPGTMAARHGVEVAIARVVVPPSVAHRPDWNSQFEALTLAGAGAGVRMPTPPAPSANASAAPSPIAAPDAWHPPAHVAPANRARFVPIVHVMWQLAHRRFEFVAAAMLSSLLIAAIAIGLRRFSILLLIPVIVGYAFLNLAFGVDWGVALIHRFGNQAPATATGRFTTNDVYNNQDVAGYHVLIRAADGNVFETTFRTDDFNVYPSRNTTRYPNVGDVFTVRYLPGHPDDFVIVRDDGSPWSNRLRCEALAVSVGQADQKANFAPENQRFEQASRDARAAFQSAGCQADDSPD